MTTYFRDIKLLLFYSIPVVTLDEERSIGIARKLR